MFLIDTNILISEILNKYEQDEITVLYRTFYQQIPLIKRVIPDFVLNEFELYMVQVVPVRYHLQEQERKEVRETTSVYIQHLVESVTLDAPSPSVIKKAWSFYHQFERTHYISFTDS